MCMCTYLYTHTTKNNSKCLGLYGWIKRLNQNRRKRRKEEKSVGRTVEQVSVSGFSRHTHHCNTRNTRLISVWR